jgi:hypothetical protein
MLPPLNFICWSGIAAMLGGVVYVAIHGLLGPLVRYLYSPSSDEDIPPILNYVETIPVLLLVLGAMAAIAGLHTLQRERYGLLGALASLTSFVGVGLILLGALADLLGLAGQPSLYLGLYTLVAGVLVATVGLLSLGGVTIATRVLPGWVGALIILGSPLAVFVFAGLYDELQLLVGVAWALVGYTLFRQARVT